MIGNNHSKVRGETQVPQCRPELLARRSLVQGAGGLAGILALGRVPTFAHSLPTKRVVLVPAAQGQVDPLTFLKQGHGFAQILPR